MTKYTVFTGRRRVGTYITDEKLQPHDTIEINGIHYKIITVDKINDDIDAFRII